MLISFGIDLSNDIILVRKMKHDARGSNISEENYLKKICQVRIRFTVKMLLSLLKQRISDLYWYLSQIDETFLEQI